MRLLYDLIAAQPLSGRYHGGAEYCKVVFQALATRKPRPQISAFYDPSVGLDPEIEHLAREGTVELLAVDGPGELRRLLSSGRFDRFYSALPYGYFDVDLSDIEFFCTVHGIRPVELPTDRHEGRYRRGLRARLAAHVKQAVPNWYAERRRREFRRLLLDAPARRRVVIVPSQYSRYSLIDQLPGLASREVHVFYSPQKAVADQAGHNPGPELLRELGLAPRSYFLIVSANRWVKNAVRAVASLDSLFQRHPWIPQRVLVLGATPDAVRVPLRCRERFVFRDYVTGPELESLYAEAFALVFPTLNEGFGYPPLEAMRHGTPVICSAVGPTTEICGDAVLYVNPVFGHEISTRALQLIHDDGEWARRSELGRRRAELVARRQRSDLAKLVDLLVADPAAPMAGVMFDGSISAS